MSTTAGPGGLDWPAAAGALQDQVDDLTAAVTALQQTAAEQAAELRALRAARSDRTHLGPRAAGAG